MVLLYSLPEPENHQSTVIAIIISYLSSQPFYAILLIKLIRRKCFKKNVAEIEKTTEADTRLEDSADNVSQHLTKPDEQYHNHSRKLSVASISIMGNACQL